MDLQITNQRLKRTYCCILLFIAVGITFSPTLRNGFQGEWDDNLYIVKNPDIKKPTPGSIAKIFSSSYVGNYQPVTMLSYMVEYRLFGMNPARYHLTGILVHGINAILVVAIAFRLSANFPVSILIGLLFAIHPLRVESVAWASEQKGLLCALFYFLSLLAYIRFNGRKKPGFPVLSLILLLLSLMSKPMAVSQPFVLLLIDYLQGKKLSLKSLSGKIPFFAAAAAIAMVTLAFQTNIGAVHPYTELASIPLFQRAASPCYGIVFYLVKTILPTHLCAMYPYVDLMKNDAIRIVTMAASLLAVAASAVTIWYFRSRSRKAVFGSLFFVLTLLPVLQVVPFGGAFAADRYSYIPSIGILYLVFEGAAFLWRKFADRRTAKVACCALLTVVFFTSGVLTWQRCEIWKDGLSLWNNAIAEYPGAKSFYNRGLVFLGRGEYGRSIDDLTRAILLGYVDNPDAYNSRGNAFAGSHNYANALADYTRAIGINPRYFGVYGNRGMVYTTLGKYQDAVADYSRAVEIDPKSVEAYGNRGVVYKTLGKFNLALADFDRAILLDSASVPAYLYRGETYVALGKHPQAIKDFSNAIRLDPEHHPRAYYDRGNAFKAGGRIEAAREDYRRACAMKFEAACRELRGEFGSINP